MISRIKTGIIGLDTILIDGLPENSVTTLVGTPGTGKTVLSLQFLYEGAKKGDKGVFLTLEEKALDIVEQGECLGWEIKKMIDAGNLIIKDVDPGAVRFQALVEKLAEKVEKERIKRLVIDSATTLWMFSLTKGEPTQAAKRKRLWQIMREIKELGCTTILTAEAPRSDSAKWYTRDTVSEFLCDVLILLDKNILGEMETRTLSVLKARKIAYTGGAYEFSIKPKEGIVVNLEVEK